MSTTDDTSDDDRELSNEELLRRIARKDPSKYNLVETARNALDHLEEESS
jgi:hypothetical protein